MGRLCYPRRLRADDAVRQTKRVEPTARRGLEAGGGGAGPRALERLNGPPSPLMGTGPSGVTSTKPSARCSVPAVSRMPPGAATAPSGQPGAWSAPHGGVVHAEIAADRAHHDVPGVDATPDLHLHARGTCQ